ncbi:MAG: ABC transporter [uncultured Sulfurovum sp.]|uniref:ABC transporter n=1 Tax=uncultured Sulfurovum sp. TaxID=269237 RepID=A0A6S6U637_9BACT|nr:MAG: ABC transporter [uncultured Sulfurovum sp.]
MMNMLLATFKTFARLHNKNISLDESELEEDLFTSANEGLEHIFSKLAYREGFNSKLLKGIKLKNISKLILPTILFLEDDKFCILTELSGEYAKIITVETSEQEAYWVSTKELAEVFTGSCFLLKLLVEEEEEAKQKHWFWSSLGKGKSLYIDLFLASFLLNLFMLATPIFTMNVYDRVVPNNAFDTLWVFVSAVIIIYLFDALMKILRTYTLEVLAKKSDVLISSRIFEHVLGIKLSHRFSSTGAFASNLREFDTIRSFLASASMATIIDLPFLLIFLVVIFIIGGNIVFVPITAALLIILYAFIIKRPLQKSIEKLSSGAAAKNAVLIESLSMIETIKSFALQGKIQWKWEESVGTLAQNEIRARLLSFSIVTFSNFILQLSTVAVLVLGVYGIAEQSLSMGGLIALVMLTSRSLAPLNQFASLISNYEQTKSAYAKLNSIMNLPTDISEHKKIERKEIKGSIEFKNVKFKYPQSQAYILDDISFKIEAGERVGILGKNGSGKSTILKLLMGLYEPESGIILIDGIDIRQFNSSALTKSMAYLPQNVVLFKGTVAQNIRESVERLSDELLVLTSKLSGVERFASKNALGYNAMVEERGEGLSGGERQSIAMARVFAKTKASLLLLDEPTNAMDNENETLVTQSIKLFSSNKTMLMVSHKNALLKLSERLILLDNGKILLDDGYDEVIEALAIKVVE